GPFFEVKTVARGACFAYYDNDGKVDLFMVNLGGPCYLLHNVSPGANHWLAFKLVGTKSNRDGIGAKIEVAAGGGGRGEKGSGGAFWGAGQKRRGGGGGGARRCRRGGKKVGGPLGGAAP